MVPNIKPKRRSDTRTTRSKKNLLHWMKHQYAAVSVKEIAAAMDWSAQKARKYAERYLYPSINRPNQPGEGAVKRFASRSMVREHTQSMGIAKIDGGYYHIRRNPQSALLFVIKDKDDGLTPNEAKALFHHDLSKHLAILQEQNIVQVVEVDDEQVWVSKQHQQRQINRRRTNKFYLRQQQMKEAAEKGEPIAVPMDEIIETVEKLRTEDGKAPLPLVAKVGMMKHYRGWSDRQAARELKNAVRRDRTADSIPAYHHSALSKKMRHYSENEQIELEHWLIAQLIQKGGISLETLSVDSTDLTAYCAQSRINKGGIDGAAIGFHGEWFYGYKIHTLVCSESELPVTWTLTPGNVHDVSQLNPLADKFRSKFPGVDLQGLLGDAGYDAEEQKEKAEATLNCAVITARNPRRNSEIKWAKTQVSQMWKRWGGKLKSVVAYLNRLPQKLLTSMQEAQQYSLLAELIRNLMFMDRRVAVERFFGRLRAFTQVENLVHQNFAQVRKFIRWAIISMLAFSLTMVEKGLPKVKLRYGHIV